MSSNEETDDYQSNGDRFQNVKQRFKDRSKKVAETKEKTKEILSKQAVKIAKQAEEHESFITKVTHFMGVFAFGGFCFLLGARPQDIRYVYCLFYVVFVPLRWIYYRYKKWHYYLLDFCYYANTIFVIMLLFYPKNEKLFMVCFSFAEGPLAWALIVWRCSLVFSSLDKLVSVLIHLLPGVVFFTIRWWDPVFFEAMHPEGTARRDGMPEHDWLSLVAVHSDAWLISVAYYFGARFGFEKSDRKRLFNMINDLPTVFDVVAGYCKKQTTEKSLISNHSSTKSKSNTKGRGSESQIKYETTKLQAKEEDEELEDEEDEDEHGDTLCGACGENYASDEFWICCDICERWFHGKCVKITPARAEHIKQYKCPSCSSNKRARP